MVVVRVKCGPSRQQVVETLDERRRRFEAQVLPHLDAAYRFARWLTRSPDDAEDVVQDAFLRAYRGFDTLRGSDIKGWLLTIVRICHFTSLKRQQRRSLVPLPEDGDDPDGCALISEIADPEGAVIQSDCERTLEMLVAALPDDYREVLILREIEDMDYRQIASVINAPIGTVMSRLSRARAALKKHWFSLIDGESRATS
jgi:RNA polymerase sigma factor (sigma-70 family)